jgi:hypothetical protein
MLHNKNKIIDSIINKKEEKTISIATVVTVNPLTIKFPPDTTAINAIATSSLYNISIGSRVLCLRYNKQYLVTAVIGNPVNKYKDYIIKQEDENRYDTETLSSDNELTLTFPPNGIYEVEARLFVDAVSSTPDLKMVWDYSNLTQLTYRNCLGHGTNTSSVYNSDYMHFHSRSMTTETTYGLVSSGWASIWEVWIVQTGSNEGTLTLEYAQNVATEENITMKANSYLGYTRIDAFPYNGSGDLETILTDMQEDITDNASNISTNTSDITSLESDMTAAQGDITDLQNDKQDNIAVIRKTADENVTDSTVLQNDNHLTYTFPSSGLYEVNLNLSYNGDPAGDILVDWTSSGTVAIYSERFTTGCAQAMTSAYDTTLKYRSYANLGDDVTYGSYSNTCVAKESFLVNVTASSSITLRWAQDTANATPTVVRSGSYMKIIKVSS